MSKSLQAIAVERAVELRGELEFAAELGLTVNQLALMAAGRMEIPVRIFLRASEIITQKSVADARSVGLPVGASTDEPPLPQP